MKIALTTIVVLLVVYFSAFSIAVLQEPVQFVEADIVIEAPEALVFNNIIDVKHYQDWCSSLKKNELSPDYNSRIVRYDLWPEDLVLSESVDLQLQERRLITRQKNDNPPSFLKEFSNDVRLAPLPDGSTQVFWRISYRIDPVFEKLINLTLLKPQLSKMVTQNLRDLKNYIIPD